MDQIFGSTPKTRGIPGACDAGVSTEEDNLPVGEDIPDFSIDGMQEYELVNLFDLNSDVGGQLKVKVNLVLHHAPLVLE